MADFNKEILKKIEIQQKFADFIYKDFRSKRFGISSCCSIDQLNKFTIKSELCNQPEKLKTYSNTSYEKELWHTNMFEEPQWLEGNCPNGCTYPETFIPNEDQLGNIGGLYYWGNNTYTDWNSPGSPPGGINTAIKVSVSDITSNLPFTSGNSQVTIYAEISSDIVLQMLSTYNTVPTWPALATDVWSAAQAAGDFPANGIKYDVPIAQFYIRQSPEGVISPHFYYNDPIFALQGGDPGSWIYPSTTTDEDGNTLYYLSGTGDFTFRLTLFGNTSLDFNAFNLNGGLWYKPGLGAGPLKIKVADGSNIYHGELTNSFPDGFPDPTTYWIPEPIVSANVAGDFEGAGNSYLPSTFEEPDLICSHGFPQGTIYYDDGVVTSSLPCTLCGFEGTDQPWSPCDDLNYAVLYEEIQNWLPYLPIGFIPAPNVESLCELCAILNESDPNGLLDVSINVEDIFRGTGAELCQCCVQSPVDLACINDSECIRIEVLDQNGNPIEGYEIIIDGGNAGVTNENGVFTTTINNASVNTDHTLNICYCFTTKGDCAQQKITIVLTDDCITECNITKAECTDIEKASEE